MLPLLVLLVLGLGLLAWFRVGAAPAVEIEPGLPALGPRTPVEVRVAEPARGLTSVRVELIQGEELREVLAEEAFDPRPFWAFWGPRAAERTFSLEVGRETVEGLREGEATLRVTAGRAGTWLRSPDPVTAELSLPVRLQPPALTVVSGDNAVVQAGSGVVVYRVGETSVRDGVEAGGWWFPGYPLPGGEAGLRFALFGAPYDLDAAGRIRLVAADEVGNEARVRFLDLFRPRPPTRDTIRLSDAFLARVVPPILERTAELASTGDLLEDYLAINGGLRQANAETLLKLAEGTEEAFLWRGTFRQLPSSQVMSSFADQRTYVFDGREVDHQDHLGFDLASTRRAPVPASNAGKVVLARFFGIYGNTVVLDHGYGLMSLYAHLSSIAIAEGDRVSQGQSLGTTGETGLAGGDHLHFTMLVHGLAVDPKEWWDRRWIRTRVAGRLGDAFRFED